MIKTLNIAVDLWLLEQHHILTRKKNKTGLDYEIKQLGKEILQFTKVFAIYCIFNNRRM